MLIPNPIIASVTVAATLITTATVNNVIETISICSDPRVTINDNDTILNQYLTISDQGNENSKKSDSDQEIIAHVPHGKTKSGVINDLKSMKRKDLVRLFKHCDAPDDLSMIEGEWDGLLLNNNLVLVSRL